MELSKICLALLLLVGLLATSGNGKPFSNIQSHDDIEKEVKLIDYEGLENEVSTKSQMDEIKVIPTPYRRHIDDWTIIIIVQWRQTCKASGATAPPIIHEFIK